MFRLKLPDLVCLNDYSGDSSVYLDVIYELFKKDFIVDGIQYAGVRVEIIKAPYFQKKEFAFWHAITEGKKEEDRIPDMERCKRISWPKIIIENAKHKNIKVWQTVRRRKGRGKQKRILISYGNWEYLIVLNIRGSGYLFCTAYPISNTHTKRKLKLEYENFKETKNAPQGT